jgi:hypothetical protein
MCYQVETARTRRARTRLGAVAQVRGQLVAALELEMMMLAQALSLVEALAAPVAVEVLVVGRDADTTSHLRLWSTPGHCTCTCTGPGPTANSCCPASLADGTRSADTMAQARRVVVAVAAAAVSAPLEAAAAGLATVATVVQVTVATVVQVTVATVVQVTVATVVEHPHQLGAQRLQA